MNRADRTEDPALGVPLFAYDRQDKPVQVTDANGNLVVRREKVGLDCTDL